MDTLRQLLRPPKSPREVPTDGDWARCQDLFQSPPPDYRRFLQVYGTGIIDGFLYILNPASANRYLNLVRHGEEVLAAFREMRSNFPTSFDMPLFPEADGYLPYGVTDNGDTLFWVTRGPAVAWATAVMGAREPEVFFFRAALWSFLQHSSAGSLNARYFLRISRATHPLSLCRYDRTDSPPAVL